jgi:hypothetical protein
VRSVTLLSKRAAARAPCSPIEQHRVECLGVPFSSHKIRHEGKKLLICAASVGPSPPGTSWPPNGTAFGIELEESHPLGERNLASQRCEK